MKICLMSLWARPALKWASTTIEIQNAYYLKSQNVDLISAGRGETRIEATGINLQHAAALNTGRKF